MTKRRAALRAAREKGCGQFARRISILDTNITLFRMARAARQHDFAQFRTGMVLSHLTKVWPDAAKS